MVSNLTMTQAFEMMSDDDLAYITIYEPSAMKSMCNMLSIEYQQELEQNCANLLN